MNLFAWRTPGTRLPNPRVWLKESQADDCIIPPLPLPPFSCTSGNMYQHPVPCSLCGTSGFAKLRIEQVGRPATLGCIPTSTPSGSRISLESIMTARPAHHVAIRPVPIIADASSSEAPGTFMQNEAKRGVNQLRGPRNGEVVRILE